MLYEIVKKFPNKIIYEEKAPFISLYQPTHRYEEGNEQDVIIFKKMIKTIERSLSQKYPRSDIESLIKPFNALLEDRGFWNNTLDGLVILASQDQCVIYRLRFPIQKLVVVGEQLQIRPLLRYFQSADRYHLLQLDGREFALYEGNRYEFDEITLPIGAPKTIEEYIDSKGGGPYVSQGPYGEVSGPPIFCEPNKNGINKDTKKYFKYVDRLVLDNYSRFMKLPLLLVGPSQCCHLFKAISNNPCLLSEGIRGDYTTLSKDQMRESAWEIIESCYFHLINRLVDRYHTNKSKLLASDDLAQIAKAALEGRVQILMLERDRMIPGMIDRKTGELKRADFREPIMDTALNDLAIMVYKSKGGIVVLPKEKMPTTTGVAAVYL